jgi:hypothetical protein
MEFPPTHANTSPEYPTGNTMQKLARLLDIRAQQHEELIGYGLIEKARDALPFSLSRKVPKDHENAVVYARPQRIIKNGYPVLNPAVTEIGICFLVPYTNEKGNPDVEPVFSLIGLVEDGIPYHTQQGSVGYTYEEAVTIHGMAMSLREAKAHGEIPMLSQDLTAVVSYDS